MLGLTQGDRHEHVPGDARLEFRGTAFRQPRRPPGTRLDPWIEQLEIVRIIDDGIDNAGECRYRAINIDALHGAELPVSLREQLTRLARRKGIEGRSLPIDHPRIAPQAWLGKRFDPTLQG